MGKITIQNLQAHNNGGSGVHIDDPNAEVSIQGGSFSGNGGPDVEAARAKSIDVSGCEFGGNSPCPPDSRQNEKEPNKPLRRYVNGWSFEKDGPPPNA